MFYMFLLVALLYATFTDVHSRTIPVWLFPLTLVSSCIYMLSNAVLTGWWNLIGLLCMLIPSLILGMIGGIGGGDILMLASIGGILGRLVMPYAIILSIISTIFFLLTKCKNKAYPIAPFALAAYIIFLIWRFFYV